MATSTSEKFNPKKSLKENFKSLDFNDAYIFNCALIDVEDKSCNLYHAQRFHNYIQAWEYAYYFVDSFIRKHSNLQNNFATIAALFTEAHSSIRCAFLCNQRGYHSDSIALLRKTHECIVRAIACKVRPKRAGKFITDSDIQRCHDTFDAKFLSELYKIESSYTHSNIVKALEPIFAENQGIQFKGVSYGPQLDEKEFVYSACLSLFWLYIMIKTIPRVFPAQVDKVWVDKSHESARMLRVILEYAKNFQVYCDKIDDCFEKIGPIEEYKTKK